MAAASAEPSHPAPASLTANAMRQTSRAVLGESAAPFTFPEG